MFFLNLNQAVSAVKKKNCWCTYSESPNGGAGSAKSPKPPASVRRRDNWKLVTRTGPERHTNTLIMLCQFQQLGSLKLKVSKSHIVVILCMSAGSSVISSKELFSCMCVKGLEVWRSFLAYVTAEQLSLEWLNVLPSQNPVFFGLVQIASPNRFLAYPDCIQIDF